MIRILLETRFFPNLNYVSFHCPDMNELLLKGMQNPNLYRPFYSTFSSSPESEVVQLEIRCFIPVFLGTSCRQSYHRWGNIASLGSKFIYQLNLKMAEICNINVKGCTLNFLFILRCTVTNLDLVVYRLGITLKTC